MIDESLLKNKKELFNKIYPALFSKRKEIYKLYLLNIREEDIWNYLVINRWKGLSKYELYDLVSDILYLDNYLIKNYVINLNNNKKNKIDILSIK